MIAEVGFITLLLSLICAVYAALVALGAAGRERETDEVAPVITLPAAGERTTWILSARNAALLTFVLLTLSTGLLLAALLGGEFQLEYVYNTTERNSDTFLKVAALWGGQAGSLLFWSWLMSAFAAGAIWLNWRSHRRLMPYVIAITMLTVAFFLLLVVAYANPFDRFWAYPDNHIESAVIRPPNTEPVQYWVLPDGRAAFSSAAPDVPGAYTDGRGMNPLLRHPGMIIHPPTLYLGFVGLVIPFAFAMAALAAGVYGNVWISATRRWTLASWVFLTLGLILGGRWAYDVLGWGGYWAWDPVENAALLPWLTGTAFLHSINIQQKRGMFRRWNMLLIILTFWLVIFGTFATRSGVINSVHSFAESPVGVPMLAFVTLVTVGSLLLFASRWDNLRSPSRLAGVLSRESLFLLNNVVFVIMAVVIFWGSYGAPIFSELFLNETITMGPPYFMDMTAPLFMALFVLMGLAPLAVWRSSAPARMGRSMRVQATLTVALVLMLALLNLGDALVAFFVLGIAITGLLTAAYYAYVQNRPGARNLPLAFLVNSLTGAIVSLLLLTLAPGMSLSFLDVGQDTFQTGATLAYGLIGFVVFVTLWEFLRGVRARVRSKREDPITALYRLFRLHQRRYGGYLIHLGIAMLSVGVVGSTLFQDQTQQTLAKGESMTMGSYTLRYEDMTPKMTGDPVQLVANVTVFRGDRQVATLAPRRDIYARGEQVTPPSVYNTVSGDLYTMLASWDLEAGTVTLKVYLNPLVGFVWLGGVMLVVGAVVAAWPPPKRPAHPAHPARPDQEKVAA